MRYGDEKYDTQMAEKEAEHLTEEVCHDDERDPNDVCMWDLGDRHHPLGGVVDSEKSSRRLHL